MLNLLEQFPEQLESWLVDQGQPRFRVGQIQRWLFSGRARGFGDMSDLPAALRQQLEESFRVWTTQIAHHQHADDGTEKLLLRCEDGHSVECVLLRDGSRRTICISSQVGCAMGCVFCASGIGGVKRNLTTGEIIEQMLQLQRLLPESERLSHIVVMGMGEPLANLDRLLPALDWAHRSKGLGISARRITISTVGLPHSIERLARCEIPYQLAISLHAPNDSLRNELVPVNSKTGIRAILEAADQYFEVSGRRITFEYVLLGGVNDRPEQATQLATLLRGRNALLNVIPYNPVDGLPYTTPHPGDTRAFCDTVRKAGVTVQVRERKGDEIDAACGQLRRKQESSGVISLEN